MEFVELRDQAIVKAKERLREPISPDKVIIYTWRCVTNKPDALERWLFNVLPHLPAEKAAKLVAEKGADAWDKTKTGSNMGQAGWDTLQKLCLGEKVKITPLTKKTAPNLHTLLGPRYAAHVLHEAGSLPNLARMTQRDCMRLGNTSGVFAGPQKKSILETHDLCVHDRALRVLCSRTILAARLDAFKGQFKGDSLKQEVLYAQ